MSSSSVSFRLRLTAAQNGLDPRTHYWFKAGERDYRRVCDGAQWSRLPNPGIPINQDCRLCIATRRADREVGRRAFSLTYQRKGVFAPGADLPLSERKESTGILLVTLFKFAEFCVGGDDARADIIRKRHEAAQRPPSAGGGDYYSGLRKVLREKHWETNDIQQLHEAIFDLDPTRRGNRKKLETYEYLKGKYVDTWRTQNAECRRGYRARVPFGELSVTVDPEVMMRTSTEDIAFKLRFVEAELTADFIGVCSYLLWEVADYAGRPRTELPGIWDVYHSRLEKAPRQLYPMEEWVHQCAADFVARSQIG